MSDKMYVEALVGPRKEKHLCLFVLPLILILAWPQVINVDDTITRQHLIGSLMAVGTAFVNE